MQIVTAHAKERMYWDWDFIGTFFCLVFDSDNSHKIFVEALCTNIEAHKSVVTQSLRCDVTPCRSTFSMSLWR